MWAAFRASLQRRPLLTNVCVSAVTMSTGDRAAQALEMQQRGEAVRLADFDPVRTMIATTWNAFLFTPIFLRWFAVLDRRFPGATMAAVAKKVLINQVVITVPINGGFLAYTTFLEALLSKKSTVKVEDTLALCRARVTEQLFEDLPQVFKRSCMWWLPVNSLNFLFVPTDMRVLPTIFASMLWSAYISLTAHHRGALANVAVPLPHADETSDRGGNG